MRGLISIQNSSGLVFSILVPLVVGLYSIWLGQDTNWDLQNYHLYNPYAYLNNRMMYDLAPAGLQTYFNPFLDVAYFFAVNHLSPKTIGFMIGVLQGLNFILIYRISIYALREKMLGNFYSLLLALAGVLTVGFISEIGTTLNDSLIAIFPLSALLIVISLVRLSKKTGARVIAMVVCAGLLAGIGSGLKLVTGIYALAICLAFFVLPFSWYERFKLAFIFGVAVLTGLAVSGGHWMFDLWRMFGNPLFPQFNDIFRGELAEYSPVRDERFLPKSIFERIFYPFIFTANPLKVSELPYVQVSWLFAYVATLSLLAHRAILFIGKTSSSDLLRTPSNYSLAPEARFLIAFFCFSYLLWLNIFGIYRYLVTIELLVPLLLFITIDYFFTTQRVHQGALMFLGAITLFNLHGIPDFGRSAWTDNIHRVEPNGINSGSDTAVVYIGGQPLAWIVPAMNIKAPVLQLVPNMPISTSYLERMKELSSRRSGRSFLVYDPAIVQYVDGSRNALANLGLIVDEHSCNHLIAYLGATKFDYKYCEVKSKR